MLKILRKINKNPLIFSSTKFTIRGSDCIYNDDYENCFGLFFQNLINFSSSKAGIRIVIDENCIFNEKSKMECKFFQNRGVIMSFDFELPTIYSEPSFDSYVIYAKPFVQTKNLKINEFKQRWNQ